MMRKGTYENTGQRVSEDRYTLGNLDLLNLRLSTLSSKFRKNLGNDAGCGDSQLLPENSSKTNLKHYLQKLNIGEAGLQRSHSHCVVNKKSELRHSRVESTSSVDEFLLPPKKKNSSKELCLSKSTPPLSSAGDAGNFPFKITPSGNLKVNSQQVVFESKKLSVLVANPEQTQVKVYSNGAGERVAKKQMAYEPGQISKNSVMDEFFSQTGIPGFSSLIGDTPVRSTNKVSSEYDSKQTSEILDPELNLTRLGCTRNEPIDWNKANLPDKRSLYMELCRRINNKKNTDCVVLIGDQEFNCHLMVLQCYSELFDEYIALKKVEIKPENCSPTAFAFIYDWMVNEEGSYKNLTRSNVLDIFISAKYLRIKDLVEQCWAFIDNSEVFSEDTAFLLYIDSKAKNVGAVCELMIPRIQDFFLILVSSQDWLELNTDDVKILLSSNYVRINSEIEVFMSAVRWLKYDWSNRDKYKYEVLKCVRFGNIAPWQLVDIKRNPENPEFMELAKDPAICKLIDDGLAFVTIKDYYGEHNDDFKHWNSVLGLEKPESRNWTGLDKTYLTYREFLIYLDQYRRNQLSEKSKPSGVYGKVLEETSGTVMTPDDRKPSMADFLTKKKVSPQRKKFSKTTW